MQHKYIYICILLGFLAVHPQVMINAQTVGYELTGMVVDGLGNAVPDVSVSIEGEMKTPVLTGSEGKFSIQVPGGKVWLLISPSRDYKPKKIFLNDRRDLLVTVVPEEVPSAYDYVSLRLDVKMKRDITGAADFPDMEKAGYLPVQSMSQYLSGLTAGLHVTSHSGMPGDGAYMSMRGIRSLYADNQPLVVVDGLPLASSKLFSSIIGGYNYDPLTVVKPHNVTNLVIVKNAGNFISSGLTASNGAVLIETLQPTETRTTIDFYFKTGVSLSPRQIPVLEANQFRVLANEILITSDYKEEDFPILFPGLYEDEAYRYIHNTKWQNEVFRNTTLTDAGFSIKGGDAISKYGLAFAYQDHQGIIKDTDYTSINLQFVGSFNVFQWLELNVSANLSNNRSGIKETGPFDATSPILASLLKAPVMAPYKFDEDGQELSFLEEVDAFGVSNPTAVITKSEAFNNSYNFLGTFDFVGRITDDLTWNSLLGLNFGNIKEGAFMPDEGMETYLDQEAYNEVRQQATYLRSLYFDNYLTYRLQPGTNQLLDLRAGARLNTNHLEHDFGIGYNTPSDEYRSLRFTQDILSLIGGDVGAWNRFSFFGNADYSYADKYYFNGKIFTAGSSRTGKDAHTPLTLFGHPFGLFYHLNGAWRISSEPFLRDRERIDDLKLRVSYGLSGNDDIGNFNSRSYYRQVKFRETTGVILGTMPVTDLKYEEVREFDAGIDLSMLGEKIGFKFDFFNSTTEDLLIYERQEAFLGYAFRPVNGGRIRNRGFEIGIGSRLLSESGFNVAVGLNLSSFRNSVMNIKGDSLVIDIPGGQLISKSGFPVNSFYGFKTDGIYNTTAEALSDNLVNDVGLPYAAGDMKFLDLGGPGGAKDGVINQYDKTIIGSPNPDFFGSLDLTASYRRFGIYVQLQAVVGQEVYNYLRYRTERMSDLSNQAMSVLNRWQFEGQETDIPRAAWEDPMHNSAFSSRWIEDGSYARIKDITFSYRLPEGDRFFSDAKVFITAYNVFTFSRYLGYDPEFSYSSSQLLQGVDYGLMPAPRVIITGVNIQL